MGRNTLFVKENEDGGEGGIRTHGTVSRTLAFEASTFNRSVTSPRLFVIVADGLVFQQRVPPPIATGLYTHWDPVVGQVSSQVGA